MLGERADWSVEAFLLARAVYLLAAGNWQRGGGKGGKPKPIKPPKTQPRRRRRRPAGDVVRRMRRLGLLPGAAPAGGTERLTTRERLVAAQLAQAHRNQR